LLNQELITKNVNLENKIYVAYSGGPDSTALLHLLAKMSIEDQLEVKAIHVNHNLSKKSKAWEDHCKKTCAILNIDLTIESAQIISDGGGIESASRKARYKIFEDLLESGDQILLAHHSDDVAETIFMRLLRGTGVDGLEGPKFTREIGKGRLIRPLLKLQKKKF